MVNHFYKLLCRAQTVVLRQNSLAAYNIKRSRRKAPKRSPGKNGLPGLFVLLLVDRTRVS